MTELAAAPDGYAQVLRGVPRAQGLVVHALLDSHGIPTVLVGTSMGLHLYTREPAHVVSVHVAADRADDARELLAAVVGDDQP